MRSLQMKKNQKQHPKDTEYQFLIERMLLSWLNNLVFKWTSQLKWIDIGKGNQRKNDNLEY